MKWLTKVMAWMGYIPVEELQQAKAELNSAHRKLEEARADLVYLKDVGWMLDGPNRLRDRLATLGREADEIIAASRGRS